MLDQTESTQLLRSSSPSIPISISDNNTNSTSDLESHSSSRSPSTIEDLFTRHFDPPFSPRRLSFKRLRLRLHRPHRSDDTSPSPSQSPPSSPSDTLADTAPPGSGSDSGTFIFIFIALVKGLWPELVVLLLLP